MSSNVDRTIGGITGARYSCLGVVDDGRRRKGFTTTSLLLGNLQHRGLNGFEALSSPEAVSKVSDWMLAMGTSGDIAWKEGPDYMSTRWRGRSRRRKRSQSNSRSRDRWISREVGARARRRGIGLACTYGSILTVVTLLLASMATSARAAFINFENCLGQPTTEADPLPLQFIPHHVWAVYDTEDNNNLNITVYGNVSGTATKEPYPPPDDPRWSDPEENLGKIEDLSEDNNKYSTLLTKLNVLSFTPYQTPSRFCDSVVQGECPLAPVFFANA